MKKSLTLQYTLQQIAFWAAAAGVISFATAFLLEKGFSTSVVGILLASGNLLSCAFQPILASWADRLGGNILKRFIIGLTMCSIGCFASTVLLDLPQWLFGLLYLLGVFTFDAMNPLNNAISVMYNANGYRIDYGMGRGIGSFAYSLSALLIGRMMADYGADWMIWISLIILVMNIVFILGMPDLKNTVQKVNASIECCSVPVFFQRYRLYCISLLGVMMLAMFHAMSENYLIEIVSPLGGDSSSVGIALFVATAIEMPVVVFIEKIRKKNSGQSSAETVRCILYRKSSALFACAECDVYLSDPDVTDGNILFPCSDPALLCKQQSGFCGHGKRSGIHYGILYSGLCDRKLFGRTDFGSI